MSFATMLVLACLVMLAVTAYAARAVAKTARRRNIRGAARGVEASSVRASAEDANGAANS